MWIWAPIIGLLMPDYNIEPGETYSLGIDTASYIGGAAVKASPFSTIMRYVTDGGSGLPQKLLSALEARTYLVNDIALVSNYEWDGKPHDGYATGNNDAYVAVSNHCAAGGPPRATIYFSLDYDAPEEDQPVIDEYFHGIYDYMAGEYDVGVYAGYYVCKRLREKYPQIKVWQAFAWSGGQVLDDIEIYQRQNDVPFFGTSVDINEIRKPGKIGAWQEAMENDEINSLIDGKPYSTDQLLQFIDFHTFNTSSAVVGITNRLDEINGKLDKLLESHT